MEEREIRIKQIVAVPVGGESGPPPGTYELIGLEEDGSVWRYFFDLGHWMKLSMMGKD